MSKLKTFDLTDEMREEIYKRFIYNISCIKAGEAHKERSLDIHIDYFALSLVALVVNMTFSGKLQNEESIKDLILEMVCCNGDILYNLLNDDRVPDMIMSAMEQGAEKANGLH